MGRREEHTELHRRFRSLLSPQRVARAARKAGFVVRKGKINPFKFVWTLTLGFACGRDRTVSGLRRAYERLAGTTLVPSSFYERFGSPLVALLRGLVEHLLETTVLSSARVGGTLAGFAEVVLADATVIRLRELLEAHFPACRTNHTKAAIKLHIVMSATAVSSRTVALTGERVNDRRKLRIGPWVKDRLLLFSRYLQQLVMESLGKERDLDGKVVNQGIAVYGNKGSTDQHAYVQQLREGVNNFFVTFIEVLLDREGESIEVEPGVTSGDYLSGFLLGTRRALHENGRESMTLTIPGTARLPAICKRKKASWADSGIRFMQAFPCRSGNDLLCTPRPQLSETA